jgi:hypothetical protein
MKEINLIDTNIVILAKNHNPSIVSKEWLKLRGIVEENENFSKFTHTPFLSYVETDNFRFIVDPDRLQISLVKINDENIEKLPNIFEKYISQLPETPYTAIGLNYNYNIELQAESLNKIFHPDKDKFTKLFAENYQLGGIIIFNHSNFIVKIDINPTFNETEKFIVNFNFHCDSKKIEEIEKRIKSYFEMKDKTQEILKGLFNE